MALHALLQHPAYRLHALLTTVTEDFDRISMHGVRCGLLQQQAASLGLALRQVLIPRGRARRLSGAGHRHLRLRGSLPGRHPRLPRSAARLPWHARCYPLWHRDTALLIRDFIAQRFKTAVVCVDPAKLAPHFVGRVIDAKFLVELPEGVDPCGENGEFHTFVFDGPIFKSPVGFSFEETVCRDGFWFCDLVPTT